MHPSSTTLILSPLCARRASAQILIGAPAHTVTDAGWAAATGATGRSPKPAATAGIPRTSESGTCFSVKAGPERKKAKLASRGLERYSAGGVVVSINGGMRADATAEPGAVTGSVPARGMEPFLKTNREGARVSQGERGPKPICHPWGSAIGGPIRRARRPEFEADRRRAHQADVEDPGAPFGPSGGLRGFPRLTGSAERAGGRTFRLIQGDCI